MGKTLSLTVVAEGVETQAQADFLREHACDELQGFYFNRPVPAAQFARLLRAQAAAAREVAGERRARASPRRAPEASPHCASTTRTLASTSALLDVGDGVGILASSFLRRLAVWHLLRRLAAAGEDDLRPVRLDLRRRLAGEFAVELVAHRASPRADRAARPCSPSGKRSALAEKEVRDLAPAERRDRALRRDDGHHARTAAAHGRRQARATSAERARSLAGPGSASEDEVDGDADEIVTPARLSKPGWMLPSVPADPAPQSAVIELHLEIEILVAKSQRTPTEIVSWSGAWLRTPLRAGVEAGGGRRRAPAGRPRRSVRDRSGVLSVSASEIGQVGREACRGDSRRSRTRLVRSPIAE